MRPTEDKSLVVRTPGKLILSGEHAVVYGNPAIAMAVNRYTETTITRQTAQKNILFNLLNLRYHQEHSLAELQRLKNKIKEKYQQFLQGNYDIRDVLKEPFELLQYAFAQFLDNRKIKLPRGVGIQTDSNIPIGCGMGSSAATVVSTMYSVASFLGLEINMQSFYQLAWEAENMQHGHSSGVDVYLVLHGGCIRFQKDGQREARPIPKRSFLLVNTGAPETTTGENVQAVASQLKNDPVLLTEFAQVTENIDRALELDDTELLSNNIRHNHELLVKIGVVPEKVQRFIAEMEQMGACAKICGAGSVRGDSAGIVLVVADNDPSEIVQRYQYSSMNVQGEAQGTSVI